MNFNYDCVLLKTNNNIGNNKYLAIFHKYNIISVYADGATTTASYFQAASTALQVAKSAISRQLLIDMLLLPPIRQMLW